MNQDKKSVIVLLATPETSASVLYGLYDVLASAGAVYLDMITGEPGQEDLDVRIATADGEPFRCGAGIPVEPHTSIAEIETPDAIVVCDAYISIHTPPVGRFPREIAWLNRAHERGALICSVCSGSLVLAEAGLLDGKDAAAHWAYRDMFHRHYQNVSFRSESMLCLTSEEDRIVTAAGVHAWHDLAIYLIARYCGHRQAIETAKVFLIAGHSEGQSPYAVMTRPIQSSDGPISDCQSWIADNFVAPNPVERMVERSGLKPRTFARRFLAETGYAPLDYVQALRMEEAKMMLEGDEQGVDEIGAAVGYEDSASFRRIFKRRTGLPPAAYRRKFMDITKIASVRAP